MQRITNNLGLKLISLVLAVLLWSHVRGEVNPLETASVDVPLKVSPPRDIVLMNEASLPEKVTVLLRGPRLSLRNIKGGALANPLAPSDQAPNVISGAVSATLDFGHSRIGEQDLSVKAVSNVQDVEVMGVKPANVSVSLDRAQNIAFPVRVQLSPSLEEGLIVVRAQATPGEVVVYGPSNALEQIEAVRARVNSKSLVPGTPRTLQARLAALDRRGNAVRGVQLSPSEVTVSVALREQGITRSLPVVVQTTGTPADGYEVETLQVSPSSLQVHGSAATLKKLSQVDGTIDIAGASGTVRRRLTLQLPQGLLADGEDAPRVAVTVRLKRTANATPGTASNAAPPPNRAEGATRPRANTAPRSPESGRSNLSVEEPPPVRHDAN